MSKEIGNVLRQLSLEIQRITKISTHMQLIGDRNKNLSDEDLTSVLSYLKTLNETSLQILQLTGTFKIKKIVSVKLIYRRLFSRIIGSL